jgi:hypothetical protein
MKGLGFSLWRFDVDIKGAVASHAHN